MKELGPSLDSHELIVLRIIGEWLDLDLSGQQRRDCVRLLTEKMTQLDMKLELNFLPPEETEAIRELISSDGRMAVQAFERNYGLIRQMGPGKMEREEPWLDPISPAEALWYRGFLYRGFDELAEDQLEEFYYLPMDFVSQFPSVGYSVLKNDDDNFRPLDRVDLAEHQKIEAVLDAVDDLTTLISIAQFKALKQNELFRLEPYLLNRDPLRLDMLFTILWDMNLLRATDDGGKPARKAVDWLKQNKEQQVRDLTIGWQDCSWNELRSTPGLICEGSGWTNNPLAARNSLISSLPQNDEWYLIKDLVDHIKMENPDFQRPGGNYETWYVRDRESGEFLSGFQSWDQVEGRLLQFLIVGPLSWLGLVNLSLEPGDKQFAYQLSRRGVDWLEERVPASGEINVPIAVGNDATIAVPKNSIQHHRFQISRFARLRPIRQDQPYIYWITPRSLDSARKQGIEPERVIEFLNSASGRPVPPGTQRAIARWIDEGLEARLEGAIILKVREPDILMKLRENPKTQPYIEETLGDLSAVVRSRSWAEFRQAAAQLGLLIDYTMEDDQG